MLVWTKTGGGGVGVLVYPAFIRLSSETGGATGKSKYGHSPGSQSWLCDFTQAISPWFLQGGQADCRRHSVAWATRNAVVQLARSGARGSRSGRSADSAGTAAMSVWESD